MAVITGGTATLPDTSGTTSVYRSDLITRTAYGTSGESDIVRGCDKFTSCIVHVKIASITSGTLNVYLQQLAADLTTWYDIASMTQITGNGSFMQSFLGGSPVNFTATDKSLSAGTVNAVPIGGAQRIALVYGGGMVSTINVGIEYIP